MATLQLTFDTDSETVTSATIGGRGLVTADVISVVLARGMARIIDRAGHNLLDDCDDVPLDNTQVQLDVARAFGLTADEVIQS